MSYFRTFLQELRVFACKSGSTAHVAVLFTVVIGTALFVLPAECTVKVMPCLFWVCSVSVMQISIRAAFEEEYNSGALEQILIQSDLPEVIVFLKILAHWVCVAVPISIVAIVTDCIVLGGTMSHALMLGAALAASLLVVNFMSAVGHTLVLGGEGGLVIAQLLIFPIVVPVVIYFHIFLQALQNIEAAPNGYIMVLLGMGIMCLIPISIFFVSYAIKLALEQN
ncbi:heme exporter protein CcmB [Candidatus Anaplasma sp. TIGMIC]|uniref:heme exporter protein CcmB n=1 Tax=Candidatus Anaplasma sp. TIGMIC TaxID=3020713 RepID=UPI00232B51C1|nr:heme exporter protein CcmB [Candidatus Anaplasma sp. TIGMIC]MDB1135782.1 heme exporter protein CcmB [Candidatus Anaplasma sp. TIGMIC]